MIVVSVQRQGLSQWYCTLSDGTQLLVKFKFGKFQIIDCTNATVLLREEYEDVDSIMSTQDLINRLAKLGYTFLEKEGSREYYARYYLRR